MGFQGTRRGKWNNLLSNQVFAPTLTAIGNSPSSRPLASKGSTLQVFNCPFSDWLCAFTSQTCIWDNFGQFFSFLPKSPVVQVKKPNREKGYSVSKSCWPTDSDTFADACLSRRFWGPQKIAWGAQKACALEASQALWYNGRWNCFQFFKTGVYSVIR